MSSSSFKLYLCWQHVLFPSPSRRLTADGAAAHHSTTPDGTLRTHNEEGEREKEQEARAGKEKKENARIVRLQKTKLMAGPVPCTST